MKTKFSEFINERKRLSRADWEVKMSDRNVGIPDYPKKRTKRRYSSPTMFDAIRLEVPYQEKDKLKSRISKSFWNNDKKSWYISLKAARNLSDKEREFVYKYIDMAKLKSSEKPNVKPRDVETWPTEILKIK